MDFAGSSDERASRSAAAHRSGTALDRRTRPSPRGVGRSEPVDGKRDADFSAAAAAMADRRQADYFLRLLAQSRRLSEHRIDRYHQAIAVCESNRDAEGAANFRHMLRGEEQERQSLDGMIEGLRQRFG
ncbi:MULTISPECIES: hypothetical protein [unclassified Mycobacterium]|uniref:hypothetical protein n=1 Tax=unclassified Mycobacterium TaxID=2642494 RepID=UPI00096D9A2E|nr:MULTISPECIES: hypothetical protein [unclassified Mycobacterium]OMC10139.1 hypothetical protein A5736_03595 [Mycobacterium sp. SP-6446]OMC55282.1 hypothetical protein A5747_14340 [Mycobacterium sp. IS-836]